MRRFFLLVALALGLAAPMRAAAAPGLVLELEQRGQYLRAVLANRSNDPIEACQSLDLGIEDNGNLELVITDGAGKQMRVFADDAMIIPCKPMILEAGRFVGADYDIESLALVRFLKHGTYTFVARFAKRRQDRSTPMEIVSAPLKVRIPKTAGCKRGVEPIGTAKVPILKCKTH